MAKKIIGFIKLQVPAGKANPSPPIGPALGQRGLNIMEFCKAFNAKTQGMEAGLPIPVVITAYADKSFTFIMKTPPATILIKKAAKIQKGSSRPNTEKVAKITRAQAEERQDEGSGPYRCRHRRCCSYDRWFRSFHGHHCGGSVMAKLCKRMKALNAKVEANKLYTAVEALELIKETAVAKFDESVDVAVQLGIDPRKSDQAVRGAVVMPEGTGKTVRVAVFTQGAKAEEALAAGADIVGFDDLAAKVKAGELDFDVVIASPDAMRVVGQLGQILGPRGLMPNPKVGTVTPNVAQAVKNAKAGQVQFRADKAGIIHAPIGRASFTADRLQKNLVALIDQLNKLKPASSKGQYLRKVAVSSTMGIGVRVDIGSINN